MRLKGVLDYLRLDASRRPKPSGAPVFSNGAGEPLSFSRPSWEVVVLQAHGVEPAWDEDKPHNTLTPACRKALREIDLHWHDLRHEYASRLVEKGVPLSQVRDLLGHASITTTERYDNQKPEALLEAAKRLETGQSFKNLSSPTLETNGGDDAAVGQERRKLLEELKEWEKMDGVSDGDRTRNVRSHSPVLYH